MSKESAPEPIILPRNEHLGLFVTFGPEYRIGVHNKIISDPMTEENKLTMDVRR